MKLILGVSFALVAGCAQAAAKVDIPVEVIDVQRVQDLPASWSVVRNVQHAKAADLIEAAEKSGAVCHELALEKIVVCYLSGGRSVGIDWERVYEEMNAKHGVK
ncbi:MAG: hypothetical protein ACNJA3_28490 (plasmid) [Pseudomonas rhizophila]|uniref:hypothetical protein n=1 Tax=Pseudomonas rhizophila TaxID=2045200 RepID=UPI003F6CF3B0